MKNTFLLIATSLCLLLLCGSWGQKKSINGSGNVQSEERNITSFDEIKVSRGIRVFLAQGNFKNLVVKADDNLLPYLKTVKEGNTLKIRLSEDIEVKKYTEMSVYVTAPQMKELQATTAASIEGVTPWKADKIELEATTAASIRLDLTAISIEADLTTAATLTLKGSTDRLKAALTTSATLNAEELTARFAELEATTGSNIEVQVTEQIGYHITTGASLTFKGDPSITHATTSAGGSVRHRK